MNCWNQKCKVLWKKWQLFLKDDPWAWENGDRAPSNGEKYCRIWACHSPLLLLVGPLGNRQQSMKTSILTTQSYMLYSHFNTDSIHDTFRGEPKTMVSDIGCNVIPWYTHLNGCNDEEVSLSFRFLRAFHTLKIGLSILWKVVIVWQLLSRLKHPGFKQGTNGSAQTFKPKISFPQTTNKYYTFLHWKTQKEIAL